MPLVLDGTNGVSGVDGTASNPAIEGTDSNTGIFYPAADTVAIGTGGTERLRVDSSGNVGVGTSSPAVRLNVQGSAGQIMRVTDGTTGASIYSGGGLFGFNNQTGEDGLFGSTTSHYLYFATNGSERMRLDASGNLGVGTSSPSNLLQVTKNQNATTRITVTNSDTTNTSSRAAFQATSGTVNCDLTAIQSLGGFVGTSSNHTLNFVTDGSTRATFTTGGTLLVVKATDDFTSIGQILRSNGTVAFTCSSNENLDINRLTTDGKLVRFFQDSIEEGNISVSGTAVSYNGGHLARYSQLLSGQRDESIVKGTVLSNLDEMCEWLDAEGNPLPNEQLNRMKVSDVEGDTNVAGVFVNWDNDDQDNLYDMNIAMTGDMIIRIAQGVTVQKGDLLMSAGDGTAKPQGDDIVRSKTVAKVTSNHVTCTYDDGSYCVPCVLMAC